MLIKELNIKEFRGIKNCSENIKLSKFTLLIGRNNSGKSSILEALSLLPSPNSSIIPFKNYTRLSLLDKLHYSRTSLIYGYAGKAHISYWLDKNKTWHIEVLDNGKSRAYYIKDGKEKYPGREDIAKYFGVNQETLDSISFFIPNHTELLDSLQKIDEKTKNVMVKEKAHIRATKLINECIDDKYTEILLLEGPLRARKELVDNYYYIYLKDLGDGIEKAIITILWIETLKPKILLWDDFEATMHPSLIKHMLKYLSKKDMQIVLSTHSIDVLYELLELKLKDTIILQLYKDKNDALHYQTINMDELQDIMDANIDPRLLIDALKL